MMTKTIYDEMHQRIYPPENAAPKAVVTDLAVQPVQPVQAVQSVQPMQPVQSVQPVPPAKPAKPVHV